MGCVPDLLRPGLAQMALNASQSALGLLREIWLGYNPYFDPANYVFKRPPPPPPPRPVPPEPEKKDYKKVDSGAANPSKPEHSIRNPARVSDLRPEDER